jgi:hypothetical protein
MLPLSSNQTLLILSEELILQKIDIVKNLQFPIWNFVDLANIAWSDWRIIFDFVQCGICSGINFAEIYLHFQ